MKTIRFAISIALVALATAVAAQKTSFKERLFPSMNHEVVYGNTDYQAESTRMELFKDYVLNWFSPRGNNPYIEVPEVSMTFHFEQAEVIYETNPVMEHWMTVPFETEVWEEELEVESWMTGSFTADLGEYGPALEVWMTTPFERSLEEEMVMVENWMTQPFENGLYEESLIVEEWMLSPFGTEDLIKVEPWMTSAWN
jgi:hypothetical protein